MIKTHRTFKRPFARTLAACAVVGFAGAMLTATNGIAAEPVGTIKKITVKKVNGEADIAAALGTELGSRCNEATRFETRHKTMRDGKPVDTRLIMCGKGDASPTARLSMLEKARANMSTSTEVDAEQRAKILAALDSAIAKLKAGN